MLGNQSTSGYEPTPRQRETPCRAVCGCHNDLPCQSDISLSETLVLEASTVLMLTAYDRIFTCQSPKIEMKTCQNRDHPGELVVLGWSSLARFESPERVRLLRPAFISNDWLCKDNQEQFAHCPLETQMG